MKMPAKSKSSAKVKIRERFINEISCQLFKNKLHEMKWGDILAIVDTNTVYEAFLNEFTPLYDKWFDNTKMSQLIKKEN